ncbi:MAG: GNAT family N-acetyltransferase [candidate division WOR-3 bacterium]
MLRIQQNASMKNKRPTLTTKRLILRPLLLSDADRVRLLAGNRKIADKMLNIPHPYKKGIAREWISTHQAKFEEGEAIHFAIVLKSGEVLIGVIGLNVNKDYNRAELGYWIGEEFWGRGYATEAARAVVEYGFLRLSLHKITSSHFARNPASGKVMRKIGMKKEGFRKEHVIKWGKYEDLIDYAIFATETRNKKR